ncbi:MAG: hypothetical protein QXN17_07935 [Nitrososphaerota archaeon]
MIMVFILFKKLLEEFDKKLVAYREASRVEVREEGLLLDNKELIQ